VPNLFIAAGIFHPEAGGPATYLHEILPALQRHEWSVRVVTYGESVTQAYPYPITRIPRAFLPLRRWRYAQAARAALQWADVVYAHTIDLPLFGKRAPRLIKIVGDQAWERCIRRGWIAPTTDIDVFQHQRYGLIVEWQKQSRARQVQAFEGVIVPSQYLKQMVVGWGVPADKVTVIYNALPPLPPQKFASQSAARAALGWQERPTLLTAARLTPWKGVDHLIAALRQLPDLQLIVAGEGEDLPRLQALAADLGERVRFVGRLPREQLYVAMQAADYFVLYSGYEGLPHTLLESLRMETPIIASAKGGNVEVVQAGVNGLLAPYGDADALRATLADAFASGRRATLAAQTHVGMERFTFDYMVQATDAALKAWV
jgi:glycosyltransferase involved in cell wall biosynthesis